MTNSSFNELTLTPLGAGDLIDRTIRLYRRHFMTLIRASVPPVVVSAVGSLLWVISLRSIGVTGSGVRLAMYVLLAVFGVVLMFIGIALNFVVLGGATRNLVSHLLMGEPVSARAIYRSVRARFWGLVGAMFALGMWIGVVALVTLFAWYLLTVVIIAVVALGGAQILPTWLIGLLVALFVLTTFIGALFLFFFLVGRVAYVPQVMMVEGRGVFDAISRSFTLARGNTRRLLAMFLFTTFATYSATMLLLLPLVWYGYLNGVEGLSLFGAASAPVWYSIGQQVIAQCSRMLLAPVWMLGLSLLYVDERVRHEGYDIELMAAQQLGEMPELPDGRHAPLAPALAFEALTSDAKANWSIERPSSITTLGLR
ncbi:MAG: hypothetical protein NVSMB56_12000 [Pyrinomonadaceae bacterium]